MAAASGPANYGGHTSVRVVVVGDANTGKSSLIASTIAGAFPERVPPTLPITRFPIDYYPDRVPITVVDTSSRPENRAELAAECRSADVIVLTYSCDEPATLDRLGTFWLPELRRYEVEVPVVVVGCKLDLRDEDQQISLSLDLVMTPIMQQFREIETCMECSALRQIQVTEVFYYAQKAVLHPTGPLFDQETQALKPRCIRALKHIFILCDLDRDGALSDDELNNFQVRCFNAPLQSAEITGVKNVVMDKLPEGVNEHGLTLTGFLFLHALFIEKGRLETTWAVLRRFGYDNDMKLNDELIPLPPRCAPDESVELTSEVVDYLKTTFDIYDIDLDHFLRPAEIDDFFSTAPASPWEDYPYNDAAERNAFGCLSLDGFLSQWALMTLLDPASSIVNLIYIGYAGDVTSALQKTPQRRKDRRRRQLSRRNVFQCYVFGPRGAGKSTLLNSLINRPYNEGYTPTTREQFVVSTVQQEGETKKTLVLREIPDDSVKGLLSSKTSLGPCDVAVFVYDSSDEISWRKSMELLVEIASHGEKTGFEVPSLIVAAKDDLHTSAVALQGSVRASQDMGIDAPIPLSVKLRDVNNVFERIVRAAQRPHLSIPETEAGRNRRRRRRLVNRSLLFATVGAGVVLTGLAAYRIYAARRNSSS